MSNAATTLDGQIGANLRELRVDLVGSLLRPPELKEAFERNARRSMSDEELARAQDTAIRAIVAEQERHGMPVVNDGEFRRLHFMESFAEVAGFEEWKEGWAALIRSLAETDETPPPTEGERGIDPVLINRKPATGRLHLTRNRPLEEYEFVAGLTSRPAKISLIGPDRILQGYDPSSSVDLYRDPDRFADDVVRVLREITADVVEAGCRYVQLDAPGFTAYVDSDSLEALRSRGDDPQKVLTRSIAAENAVIDQWPGVTFGVHVCRGNRQGHWHREGGYDAVAEQLFNELEHDRLLLEYDTERAGTFEALRYVPRGKIVVLGLITTKDPRLETVDELKRRIDEAAAYVPIDQLALSPQCGFASVIQGNRLTEEDQWRKLELMQETATQVWGGR